MKALSEVVDLEARIGGERSANGFAARLSAIVQAVHKEYAKSFIADVAATRAIIVGPISSLIVKGELVAGASRMS